MAPVNQINPFLNIQTPAIQGIKATQNYGGGAPSGGTSFSGGSSGQTVGLNENMNGQAVFSAGQAGIKPGILGAKFNSYA